VKNVGPVLRPQEAISPDSPPPQRLAHHQLRARRFSRDGMTWLSAAPGLVLAAFVLTQLAHLTGQRIGPSLDEGIYITAGLRTMSGQALTDGYMTWFAGSLLWPLSGAAGYSAAGLTGARIVALSYVVVGLAGVLQATATLFGARARLWAAVFVCGWGAVLGVSRIAEYDALAVAGLGLTMWALTNFVRSDHRGWLVLGAVTFGVAVVGKYAAAFVVLSLVGFVVLARERQWPHDLLVFGACLSAVLLAYFLPFREQLAVMPGWRIANNPSFGATTATIAYTLAWHAAIPTALVAIGGAFAWRRDRAVGLVLAASALVFPAYHLFAGNTVGASKHVVLGLLPAVPLIGLALSRLASTPRRTGPVLAGLLAFTAFGWQQAATAERSWPDVRPAADYLASHMEDGQLVLNNGSWPYILSLHGSGVLSDLSLHYDNYRLLNEPLPRDLCDADWYVDQQGYNDWEGDVRSTLHACDGFELVHSSESLVTNLGADLRWVTYGVRSDVWRNSAAAGAADATVRDGSDHRTQATPPATALADVEESR
jgi:hypothetical protein